MKDEVLGKMGLNEDDLGAIRNLEHRCISSEVLNMKLNWDMLQTRPENAKDDFFYIEDGNVIGYLGMYGFGRKEIEITGMVNPEFRRKGVFTRLFNEAVDECKRRNIEKLILVCDRNAASGISFAKEMKLDYDFSEFRMIRNNTKTESVLKHGIELKRASEEDKEFLFLIDSNSFGDPGDEVKEFSCSKENINSSYIAALANNKIGKIRLAMEEGNGTIYGFGVLPELRGRGYGREILELSIMELLRNDPEKIILEVACENERALNLYKSCGFEIKAVYDYYSTLI